MFIRFSLLNMFFYSTGEFTKYKVESTKYKVEETIV